MSHMCQACRGWSGDVVWGGKRSAGAECGGDLDSLQGHGLQRLTLVLFLSKLSQIQLVRKIKLKRPKEIRRKLCGTIAKESGEEGKSKKRGQRALNFILVVVLSQFAISEGRAVKSLSLLQELPQTTQWYYLLLAAEQKKIRAVTTLVYFVCRRAHMELYVSHETGNTYCLPGPCDSSYKLCV